MTPLHLDFSDCDFSPVAVPSSPYPDCKPGTSGIRKKTQTFVQNPHYFENFVQAILDVERERNSNFDTLIVSGDGRYWSDVALAKTLSVAFANGVKQVWIGEGGLLSTPAVSAVVREKGPGSNTSSSKNFPGGAFCLTASHNPGGREGDFGVKYSTYTGGQDDYTYKLAYERACGMGEFRRVKGLGKVLGGGKYPSSEFKTDDEFNPESGGEELKLLRELISSKGPDSSSKGIELGATGCSIKLISTTEAHLALLKSIFDFDKIRSLIRHPGFTAKFDCMCGVQGPYAKRILVDELGVAEDSLLRATPELDFGGDREPHHGHADPNLTHAWDLVDKMGLKTDGSKKESSNHSDTTTYPFLGAAWDGDADRNMILGNQFFVIPSDALAVIVANAESAVPKYFPKGPRAAARSMPTSRALDVVCAAKGIRCFETPTGWKFFGNLMEAKATKSDTKSSNENELYTPLICGEEAFGVASCHLREKDGMWAVLMWLSILAEENKEALCSNSNSNPTVTTSRLPVGVSDVLLKHWLKYGRHYYARWDYEELPAEKAAAFMENLKNRITEADLTKNDIIGRDLQVSDADSIQISYKIQFADSFDYTDPVDNSRALNQGVRVFFENGSRAVFRLSGTGVVGATIRVYLEKFVEAAAGEEKLTRNHLQEVNSFGKKIVEMVEIERFTGLKEPTLRT